MHYILIHWRKKDDDITPLEEYVLWTYLFMFARPSLFSKPQRFHNNHLSSNKNDKKKHPKSHLISLAQLVIIRSSWMYAMLASRASDDNLKGSGILDGFCRAVGKTVRFCKFSWSKILQWKFECLVGCYVNQFEGETLERILWRKARWRRKTTRHSWISFNQLKFYIGSIQSSLPKGEHMTK